MISSNQNELSVADIAAMLRRDADALARHLLPHGKFNGGEWVCRGRNSPTGDAISVHVRQGPKQGVCGFWNGSQKGGDMLDLVGHVQDLDKAGAVQWAKRWLGLPSKAASPNDILRARGADALRKAFDRAPIECDVDREQRIHRASHIWKNALPLGGAASEYLRHRGIDPSVADGEIRMVVGLPHPEGGTYPALIARVTNVEGRGVGVWRVFVKPDGSGKAPVEAPKLGLGNVAGGAVRIGGLWPEIGVAEGIETALACRQIARDAGQAIPVWATLSTSGMRSFLLPEGVERVRIFADNDPIKFRKGQIKESPGMAAAEALHDSLSAAGYGVTIEVPPSGLDWLDVLIL